MNRPRPVSSPRRQALGERYLLALGAHLGPHGPTPAAKAHALGRAALAADLVTLDLAALHADAILKLSSRFDFTGKNPVALRRAGQFFTRALVPLEAKQRETRETNRQLKERNATLRRHTAELASGNRKLEREVARRLVGETKLRDERERYRVLFLQSHVMQRKLRQLTRQILIAQEEERKKISRELHDEVVQTLVGINVELATLGKDSTAGLLSLKTKIARTQRLVTDSVNAVHRFARELRPAVLDDLGLIPALHAYCKNLAVGKKLKIKLTLFSGVEALGGAARTVLFRVAQEALTNVVRHAEASRVTLDISPVPGAIRMEITDNGRAFPVSRALLAPSHRRLGLVGMRERVEMIGGVFTITSVAGRGTSVRADVPLHKPRHASTFSP
jgi:signal transduction histidine kinase